MPRFTRAELESFHGAEVPDLVGPGVRLVFVGINPGLMTAALQIHFGNPGNRFRPALVGAGLLEPPRDGRPGMTHEDLATLVSRGVGITNLVPFATARADELTRAQLLAGRARLEGFVAEHRPRVVAMLGITAYRVAFDRPRATSGRQPEQLGDARPLGGAEPQWPQRARDGRLPGRRVRRAGTGGRRPRCRRSLRGWLT